MWPRDWSSDVFSSDLAESVHWLELHLAQFKGTVIAITHDRYFLDNVAGWILELDRGEGIPWKGNYSSWLDQKSKRLAQEQRQASKDRKSTRLNSSHVAISYADNCLTKNTYLIHISLTTQTYYT